MNKVSIYDTPFGVQGQRATFPSRGQRGKGGTRATLKGTAREGIGVNGARFLDEEERALTTTFSALFAPLPWRPLEGELARQRRD